MRNKYILLIYKKIDGTISTEELDLLNRQLIRDSKLREEEKIISNIFEKLKVAPQESLPEQFSSLLKKRITDYKLNKKEQKTISIPVFKTAMALTTVFVIVFALSYNLPYLYKASNNSSEYQTQLNQSTQTADKKTANVLNEEQPSVMLSRAVPQKVQSEKANINENNLTADFKEYEASYTTENSLENKADSNSGGGGSSASQTNTLLPPVINCKPGAFKFLQCDTQENQLSYSIKRFDEFKEKLKDFIISIENEENINSEFFIVKETEN